MIFINSISFNNLQIKKKRFMTDLIVDFQERMSPYILVLQQNITSL